MRYHQGRIIDETLIDQKSRKIRKKLTLSKDGALGL
jgi:hypothetical protein